jgi:hypothetical protein
VSKGRLRQGLTGSLWAGAVGIAAVLTNLATASHLGWVDRATVWAAAIGVLSTVISGSLAFRWGVGDWPWRGSPETADLDSLRRVLVTTYRNDLKVRTGENGFVELSFTIDRNDSPKLEIERTEESSELGLSWSGPAPSFVLSGGPGSGKTTFLLRLAVSMLETTDLTPCHFSAASWHSRQEPFDAWLRRSLTASYLVPPAAARQIVQAPGFIPMVDGLDEIYVEGRNSALREIHQWRLGGRSVVVASRPDPSLGLLAGMPTVHLNPLAPEVVADYLRTALSAAVPESVLTFASRRVVREGGATPLALRLMAGAMRVSGVDTPSRLGNESPSITLALEELDDPARRILAVMQDGVSYEVAQLSGRARMQPSEVAETLARLRDSGLVSTDPGVSPRFRRLRGIGILTENQESAK